MDKTKTDLAIEQAQADYRARYKVLHILAGKLEPWDGKNTNRLGEKARQSIRAAYEEALNDWPAKHDMDKPPRPLDGAVVSRQLVTDEAELIDNHLRELTLLSTNPALDRLAAAFDELREATRAVNRHDPKDYDRATKYRISPALVSWIK